MKIKLFLTACLMTVFFVVYSGNPVSDVQVYIEKAKKGEQQAFHKTGDSGGATFSKLEKGVYNIVVVLPQQSGKLAHSRKKVKTNLKVGYNSEKRAYYIVENEGNFIIRYSGIKKITDSNIAPMYEVRKKKKELPQIVIGKFEVKGNSGGFTMKVEALSDKSFKKEVDKISDSPSLAIIRSE